MARRNILVERKPKSSNGPSPQGGYEYTFVDDKLPQKYLCSICTFVARGPYQVNCCASVYCKSCLDQLQKSSSKQGSFRCPNCRKSLRSGKYFPDGIVERDIRSLELFCTNKERGCKWTGELKNIDKHLGKCPYEVVVCTNERCSVKIERQNLDQHLTSQCCYRQFLCPFCKMEGVHLFITGEHLEECPDLPMPCPVADCDEYIKRCHLEEHTENCPQQLVSCAYKDIGCDCLVKLCNLEAHNHENVNHHLALAVTIIAAQGEHIKDLSNQMEQNRTSSEEALQSQASSMTQALGESATKFEKLKLTLNTQLWCQERDLRSQMKHNRTSSEEALQSHASSMTQALGESATKLETLKLTLNTQLQCQERKLKQGMEDRCNALGKKFQTNSDCINNLQDEFIDLSDRFIDELREFETTFKMDMTKVSHESQRFREKHTQDSQEKFESMRGEMITKLHDNEEGVKICIEAVKTLNEMVKGLTKSRNEDLKRLGGDYESLREQQRKMRNEIGELMYCNLEMEGKVQKLKDTNKKLSIILCIVATVFTLWIIKCLF